MSENTIKYMTDDELKEINKKIDDWKKANPDWADMERIENNLKLFKLRTKKPKNRKAAYTSLKLHFKNTADFAIYAEKDDLEDLIEEGYLKSDGSAWESPFTVRRKTTEIDPILEEIMNHRVAFAEMLDKYLNIVNDNVEKGIDGIISSDWPKNVDTIDIIMNYVNTLKFEVRNKSSINADSPVHNFSSWEDKMKYDNELMQNTLKYAYKNRKVKLDATTKVKEGKNKGKLSRKPHSDYKWDGSLENGLEINFTPKNRSRSATK